MDYTELAEEYLKMMHYMRNVMPQQRISDNMRGEAFMMQYIAMRGGYVLPSEISNEMGITSARIAAALNNLENKGFVTRQIDRSDRRRILVALTEEGAAVTEEHKRSILEAAAKMLSILGEEDAKEYVRITAKLVGHARAESES